MPLGYQIQYNADAFKAANELQDWLDGKYRDAGQGQHDVPMVTITQGRQGHVTIGVVSEAGDTCVYCSESDAESELKSLPSRYSGIIQHLALCIR
jgi:hypothetical protein